MKTLFTWALSAIAILITAYILPGVSVSGILTALVLAVVLSAINILIKPVLLVLTLPINILTLGLFTLVINAGLVMLAAAVVPGFMVDGFWWALLFGIVLFVVSSVLARFGKK